MKTNLRLLLATVAANLPALGFAQAPDVVIGNLTELRQYGRVADRVGLGLGITCCNAGDADLDWAGSPSPDHPAFAQNLYRLKNDRFEQIGQGWLKHGFSSANDDECNFGCDDPGTNQLLGAGCSDTYSATTNASYDFLGSRAWVNPYTGSFPGDAHGHWGHLHDGLSHRLVVADADLNPAQNAGATYYAEGQVVSAHEHSAGTDLFNNSGYRRFNVNGQPGGSWTFSSAAATIAQPAIYAWTGATHTLVEPEPGADGRAILAWKVTALGGGMWHYEYALFNLNYSRAFRSFAVPASACDAQITNTGFHSPENPAGFLNDGTAGDQGFSNISWTFTRGAAELEWATQSFSQNENANALRWGTLYNFRFDANVPPVTGSIRLTTFKPGSPEAVLVAAQVPQAAASPCDANCDGSVNGFDIQPFVQLLGQNPPPPCSSCAGDTNGDGSVNQFDIQPFVDCLGG